MAAPARPFTALRPPTPHAPERPFDRSAPAQAVRCDCHYCGSALPRGRAASFCPYCGQDLTVRQCPACSTDLDFGWRFCVSCGRQAEVAATTARGG